jgi:hypothetical protein
MPIPPPYQPVRLGHLVPERRPIVVLRPNPLYMTLAEDDPRRAETPELVDVILQAYVYGPRCPGVIKAELARIEEVYLKALADISSQVQAVQAGAAATGTADFIVAWHTFVRESLEVLVPGLTSAEADVLAAEPPGEGGPGTDLMKTLGLMGGSDAEEGEARPEVVGEVVPSITAPSSPTSAPSTD